jgi:hypothetical protein
MGDYKNGKSNQGAGDVKNINISQDINIEALAAAVAKAIGKMTIRGGTAESFTDTFDNGKSMEALAKAMVIQRSKNKSNFEDLGSVKETKKDKKSVDKTIDLLSNLD